jgi:glycosyltransferase involved in cell wall biosynthesis
MKLEICIPTYDRSRQLRRTIETLRPQLVASVGILILDNCSPEPVTHETLGLSQPDDRNRVRIVRNRANIGSGANIARCFECCDGEFLWLLGDDEVLRPDAIACILDHIQERPEFVAFNFRLPGCRRVGAEEGSGVGEFIDRIDELGNYMLISNNVYRIAPFRPRVHVAYQYAYAFAPHLALLLDTLRVTHGRFFVSAASLLQEPVEQNVAAWSISEFALRRMALLTLPLTRGQRAKLKEKILQNVRVFNHVFVTALMESTRADGVGDNFRLRKIYAENFAEPFSVRLFLRYALFRLALLAPATSLRLISSLGDRRALQRVAENEKIAVLRSER